MVGLSSEAQISRIAQRQSSTYEALQQHGAIRSDKEKGGAKIPALTQRGGHVMDQLIRFVCLQGFTSLRDIKLWATCDMPE